MLAKKEKKVKKNIIDKRLVPSRNIISFEIRHISF